MIAILGLILSLATGSAAETAPPEGFDLQVRLEKVDASEKVARVALTSEGCMSWIGKTSKIESDDVCRKTLRDFRAAFASTGKVLTPLSSTAVYTVQLRTAAGTDVRRIPADSALPLKSAVTGLVGGLK